MFRSHRASRVSIRALTASLLHDALVPSTCLPGPSTPFPPIPGRDDTHSANPLQQAFPQQPPWPGALSVGPGGVPGGTPRSACSPSPWASCGGCPGGAGMPPVRALNIFSVWNKEQREKARERLQDELNRGYFDEFKELKDTGGRLAPCSQRLLPARGAPVLPATDAYEPSGARVQLPQAEPLVLLVSFRAGAQEMVNSWIQGVLDYCAGTSSNVAPQGTGGPRMMHLCMVESGLLSVSVLRPLVLRMLKPPALPRSHTTTVEGNETQLGSAVSPLEVPPVAMAYAFGDTWALRKSLRIRNRLTAHVLLIDPKGRARWQGTGLAGQDEVSSLVHAWCLLNKELTSKTTAHDV